MSRNKNIAINNGRSDILSEHSLPDLYPDMKNGDDKFKVTSLARGIILPANLPPKKRLPYLEVRQRPTFNRSQRKGLPRKLCPSHPTAPPTIELHQPEIFFPGEPMTIFFSLFCF